MLAMLKEEKVTISGGRARTRPRLKKRRQHRAQPQCCEGGSEPLCHKPRRLVRGNPVSRRSAKKGGHGMCHVSGYLLVSTPF